VFSLVFAAQDVGGAFAGTDDGEGVRVAASPVVDFHLVQRAGCRDGHGGGAGYGELVEVKSVG